MGFNPDDFEYAPLGRLHSIGPGSIDHVTVRGGHISELTDRFMKASVDYNSEWAEHAGFGMGPRRWTLLGPSNGTINSRYPSCRPSHPFSPSRAGHRSCVSGMIGSTWIATSMIRRTVPSMPSRASPWPALIRSDYG